MAVKNIDNERVIAHFKESSKVKESISNSSVEAIVKTVSLLVKSFKSGGKLLLCGNGGSAADCQHMSTEFVSRLTRDFNRPGIPSIALTTDTSYLTAFANDGDFNDIFMRQVQTLGKKDDVLIGISTSGNSQNIIRAIEAAKKMKIKTVVLIGDKGLLKTIADISICVPSANTQFIQESHLSIEHIICELVEDKLYGKLRLKNR